MRVGLFTESFDTINGVSTSVKTLAGELTQHGSEPVVVCPRLPGLPEDEMDGALRILRLPSWRTPFNPENPFCYPPVGSLPPRLLRSDAGLFDVVHTQQPFGIGLHGRVTAKFLGVPLVSTFHTLYQEYTHYAPFVPRDLARSFLGGYMRRYYNHCDAIVTPSRASAKVLETLGVQTSKLHVVPTGVSVAPRVLPAAVEQARKTYGLPATAPVLLFVGRIAKEKNLVLLLEAFARLCTDLLRNGCDSVLHPRLLIVGSGPYLAECKRLVATEGIEAWTQFTGFLTRTELAPIYTLSSLFVFPSPTETQGIVLSEAQSFGLPCVLARGGGGMEFVRDSVDAVLTEPTPEAFHAAIAEMLNDYRKRRTFAEEALKSPLRPTPGEMARRILQVYESVQRGNDQNSAPVQRSPFDSRR